MDQEFINQLAEKLSKLGTKRPLGFHYAHPFGTVPPDSIICNGAEYNRALYADFFTYATEQGWVKTETEWQSIASQNNGYCSYYSDGDGSTTFRTPKFAPFMQIAIASGNVGKYHQAGLPNITGSVSISGGENDLSRTSGTLVSSGALTASSRGTSAYSGYSEYGGRYWSKLDFSASNSDKTYGRSNTVQPESSEWMICVVVFGVATNVGSVDVANVMGAVAQVQADVSTKVDASLPHIVNKWSDENGGWWRKYSDGWIEQGGAYKANTSIITFEQPFSTTNYTLVATSSVLATKKTTGLHNLDTNAGSQYKQPGNWFACGY